MEKISEKQRLEKIWFEEAREQTTETLPKFINHVMNDYRHDYGTVCHAIAACSLAAAWAANKHGQGYITGFQASFVMWDFIKEWMYSSNQSGLRIVDYDDCSIPNTKINLTRLSQRKPLRASRKQPKRVWKKSNKDERRILTLSSIGKVLLLAMFRLDTKSRRTKQ